MTQARSVVERGEGAVVTARRDRQVGGFEAPVDGRQLDRLEDAEHPRRARLACSGDADFATDFEQESILTKGE